MFDDNKFIKDCYKQYFKEDMPLDLSKQLKICLAFLEKHGYTLSPISMKDHFQRKTAGQVRFEKDCGNIRLKFRNNEEKSITIDISRDDGTIYLSNYEPSDKRDRLEVNFKTGEIMHLNTKGFFHYKKSSSNSISYYNNESVEFIEAYFPQFMNMFASDRELKFSEIYKYVSPDEQLEVGEEDSIFTVLLTLLYWAEEKENPKVSMKTVNASTTTTTS